MYYETEEGPAAYLGDGLYSIYDGFNIWLRVGSHQNKNGQVCLEPPVFESLVKFQKEAIRQVNGFSNLCAEDVGKWVEYNDGVKPPEKGRISSYDNNRKVAFVVYKCYNWDDFKSYTGQGTPFNKLTFCEPINKKLKQ